MFDELIKVELLFILLLMVLERSFIDVSLWVSVAFFERENDISLISILNCSSQLSTMVLVELSERN